MGETGILKPDARVELLNGEIVDMSPIGSNHGGTTKSLNHIFARSCQERYVVSVQDPIRLDGVSEPEPDLMLLKPEKSFYRERHPGPDDVLLLIEVADASLERDREKKLSLYGKAGISDYWIVNLLENTIEVHREPTFTGYSSIQVFEPGQEVAPLEFPGLLVSVGEVLNVR